MKLGATVTPVVYDPLIVPSIKGCIYLYNAERDAIIQYTWDIVRDLLVDVDKTDKGALKKSIDAKWKAARKKFTKDKVYALTSQQKESAPARAPENAAKRWDAGEDEGFELEDLG
jgi:hypothetical protein